MMNDDDASFPRLASAHSTASGVPKLYFPSLDGLRGLAAFYVLVHHYFQHVAEDHSSGGAARVFSAFTGAGSYGVDVFFVLSGFVITLILLERRDKPSYFHDFYWKRVLRILPVYFVHLLAWELTVPHAHAYVVLSLLFVVNFAYLVIPNLEGPAWTLAIEEQFYLIWPQFTKRLSSRNLFRVAASIGFVSVSLRFFACYRHGGFVLHNTVFRLDGLALGALIALQKLKQKDLGHWLRSLFTLLNGPANLAICLALFSFRFFPAVTKVSRAAEFTAVNLLAYALIRYMVAGAAPFGCAWLARPFMRWLGAISYAMYMYHPFVLGVADRIFGEAPVHLCVLAVMRFLLVCAVVFGICFLSRRYVELPVQRWRKFVIANVEQLPLIVAGRQLDVTANDPSIIP